MTTTEDGGGWHRRRAGCSLKDTAAPDHADHANVMSYLLTYTAVRFIDLTNFKKSVRMHKTMRKDVN